MKRSDKPSLNRVRKDFQLISEPLPSYKHSPPPLTVRVLAFGPTTAIVLIFFVSRGRTPAVFLRRTIASDATLRFKARSSGVSRPASGTLAFAFFTV